VSIDSSGLTVQARVALPGTDAHTAPLIGEVGRQGWSAGLVGEVFDGPAGGKVSDDVT
jgi:hypothetical protein